jgi:hypothetical protein
MDHFDTGLVWYSDVQCICSLHKCFTIILDQRNVLQEQKYHKTLRRHHYLFTSSLVSKKYPSKVKLCSVLQTL